MVEYVDLQYNSLSDSHTNTLKYLIKEQFELKENLRWRLGLRNPIEVNTTALGIRFLNLNHNKLGDQFAFQFSDQMGVCDHYMKSLTVRYNLISPAGVEKLCMGVSGHKDYIGFDIRDNPGWNLRSDQPNSKILEVLQLSLLKNIRENVVQYKTNGKRMKLEWIFPCMLGIQNNLDEQTQKLHPKGIRTQFCKLILKISSLIELPYDDVFKAFLGHYDALNSKLASVSKRVIKRFNRSTIKSTNSKVTDGEALQISNYQSMQSRQSQLSPFKNSLSRSKTPKRKTQVKSTNSSRSPITSINIHRSQLNKSKDLPPTPKSPNKKKPMTLKRAQMTKLKKFKVKSPPEKRLSVFSATQSLKSKSESKQKPTKASVVSPVPT